jgi:hypothetical protein
MRTVSVKEAAQALGVSPRAIQYRLQNGDLKGTRNKNQFGVLEWRIWATKEIAEGLKSSKPEEQNEQELDFDPEVIDAVEAESINIEEPKTAQPESNWLDMERDRLRILAEEMTRPLVETIRKQEQVIADQTRQLKLLPDLQKQAEKQHKTAEIKALEVEALKKQIAALEEEKVKAAALEEKIHSLEAEQAKAESTTAKLVEVEQALADLKARDEVLRQELEKAKQPFWKKLFGK